MRYLLIIFLLLLTSFSALADDLIAKSSLKHLEGVSGIELTYHEASEDKTSQFKVSFKKNDLGYILQVPFIGNQITIYGDKDFKTNKLIKKHLYSSEELIITRNKNMIFFNGYEFGKALNKKIKVGSEPWLGNIALLMGFAMSPEKVLEFYMLSPQDNNISKFQAEKIKQEEVIVNGIKYLTVKTKVTLADWRKLFWYSYYWFRFPDGILVKTEERRGGPGTPNTELTLIKIQDLNGGKTIE